MSKWNDAQTLQFINLYVLHTCLWKTDTADYKSRELRKKAVLDIAAEMSSVVCNFNELECKIKIKNIRSHYGQELKKIKQTLKKYGPGAKVHKPTLPWFKLLDTHIRPYVIQKAGLEDDAPEVAEEDKLVFVFNDNNDSSSSADETKFKPIVQDPLDISVGKRQPIRQCNSNSSKRKYIETEEDCNSVSTGLERVENVATSTKTENKTEFDIFGQSIAVQLNNMPLEDALHVQLEIQQKITEKRIQIHRRHTSTDD